MIELCNLRKIKPIHPYDVRVDRSSPLGNPFKDNDRGSQCDRYEAYFNNAATLKNDNTAIHTELQRLYHIHKQYGKLRLFCWCVPLRCHSMTIKTFLDKYI